MPQTHLHHTTQNHLRWETSRFALPFFGNSVRAKLWTDDGVCVTTLKELVDLKRKKNNNNLVLASREQFRPAKVFFCFVRTDWFWQGFFGHDLMVLNNVTFFWGQSSSTISRSWMEPFQDGWWNVVRDVDQHSWLYRKPDLVMALPRTHCQMWEGAFAPKSSSVLERWMMAGVTNLGLQLQHMHQILCKWLSHSELRVSNKNLLQCCTMMVITNNMYKRVRRAANNAKGLG